MAAKKRILPAIVVIVCILFVQRIPASYNPTHHISFTVQGHLQSTAASLPMVGRSQKSVRVGVVSQSIASTPTPRAYNDPSHVACKCSSGCPALAAEDAIWSHMWIALSEVAESCWEQLEELLDTLSKLKESLQRNCADLWEAIWNHVKSEADTYVAAAAGGCIGAAGAAALAFFGIFSLSSAVPFGATVLAAWLGGAVAAPAVCGGVIGILIGVVVNGVRKCVFVPSPNTKSNQTGAVVDSIGKPMKVHTDQGQKNCAAIKNKMQCSLDELTSAMRKATEVFDEHSNRLVLLEAAGHKIDYEALVREMFPAKGTQSVTTHLSSEDISNWDVRTIKHTMNQLEQKMPRNTIQAYHYTNASSAKLIMDGGEGLKVSNCGSDGGGVYFSSKSPVADDDSVGGQFDFLAFQKRQLKRNYGDQLEDNEGDSRRDNVDYVFVVQMSQNIVEDVGDGEPDTIIVRDTVYPDFFPYKFIRKVYKLKPAA